MYQKFKVGYEFVRELFFSAYKSCSQPSKTPLTFMQIYFCSMMIGVVSIFRSKNFVKVNDDVQRDHDVTKILFSGHPQIFVRT